MGAGTSAASFRLQRRLECVWGTGRRGRSLRSSKPQPAETGTASLEAVYTRAELGGRVGFGSVPAILIVDFQRCFVDPSIPGGADFSHAIVQTRELLAVARTNDVPAFFTRVAYQQDLADAGLFVQKCPSLRYALEDTENVEIDARLERRATEPLITKKFASAFYGTELVDILKKAGIDTLVICGCTTSGCVRASVVDALQNGFRAVIPRQCVADIAEGPHEWSLFDIDSKYGDVTTTHNVIAALTR
jgi:maleamate amidohydrolase